MRLHILSDLHLEFGPFDPPKPERDLVILAGDTHPKLVGVRWAMDTFKDVPVLYLSGNHEFYREKHPRLIEKMRELAQSSNVHILENNTFEWQGWRFFGATLWTDFQLHSDIERSVAAGREMNDFKLIRISPAMRRFSPEAARKLFYGSKDQLARFLKAGDPRRSVVLTHHAPSLQSIPLELRSDPISAAYASNLDDFILEHQPALWVHGHVHKHQDYRIGSTRIVANPRGYVGHEDGITGFIPNLVVEV